MPPAGENRVVTIKVDTGSSNAAIQTIAKQFGLLNKNVNSMASGMGLLSGAFKSWLGFLGVQQITQMSDSIQQLSGQLKLITGSTQGATDALAGIAGVADRTNQSVTGIGSAFVRYAQVLKPAGANTQEVLALIETLTNSFRLSRVSTEGISEGVTTLSQAFIRGAVSGRELRTILTQNVVVANLLKQTFGGDIYQKAQDGAINITAVMKVLAANQAAINAGAQQLAPTFGQTLTKAMNIVTLSIGSMNEQFGLSSKFAAVVGFAMTNLADIATVLGGVITFLALTQIEALITTIGKLGTALKTLAIGNPVLLGLTAIATLGALIYENWDKLSVPFGKVHATLLEFAADAEGVFLSLTGKFATFLGTTLKPEAVIEMVTSMKDLKDQATALRESLLPTEGPSGPTAAEKMQADLDSLASKVSKMPQPLEKLKAQLGDLNKLYLSGAISLTEYNTRLDKFDLMKLTRQFSEGQTDIFKFNEEMSKLEIQGFTQDFNRGELSLGLFNKAVAGSTLDVLNEQLQTGRISLAQYSAQVIKLEDEIRPGSAFYSGVASFIESVGTISQGIAKATTQAFDQLSDNLVSFIKTGKFAFADFTKAILDDITTLLVRAAIVKPLAEGIMGALGIDAGGPAYSANLGSSFSNAGAGSFGSAGTFVNSSFANGGIMTSGGALSLRKYASGGIASSPQLAMFGEGRTPEAYVPLPDGRSIPVTQTGGGGTTVSQTIIIQSDGTATGNSQGTGQNAKQLADLMRQVTLDTIIKQKKSGGLLA